MLARDTSPVVNGVTQSDVGGLAHEDDAALAGSLRDVPHTGRAAQDSVVSRSQPGALSPGISSRKGYLSR